MSGNKFGLPPKHALNAQNSMPVQQVQASASSAENMPISVSEMLRKRAEMKKGAHF